VVYGYRKRRADQVQSATDPAYQRPDPRSAAHAGVVTSRNANRYFHPAARRWRLPSRAAMAAAPAPASPSGAKAEHGTARLRHAAQDGWVKPQGLSRATASARAVEVGAQLFGGKLATDRETFLASPGHLSLPSAHIDRGGTVRRTPNERHLAFQSHGRYNLPYGCRMRRV
jgi:hypothetical protein